MGVSASSTIKTPSAASNGGGNAAVSSEQIQIHGQNGFFGKLTISRTMPAVLTNRMTHFDWTNFCDAVDASLLPDSMLTTQAFFAFVLVFAVNIGQLKDTDFPEFPKWIVSFVLIGVLVFVGRYGKLKIDQGLRKVCEDTSAVHPGIIFQAERISSRSKATQLYIEVCVSNGLQMTAPTTEHGNLEVSLAAPSPTSASLYCPTTGNGNPALSPEYVPEPAYVTSFVVTREERLRELDRIKGLLTEHEYEGKRAEILAEI